MGRHKVAEEDRGGRGGPRGRTRGRTVALATVLVVAVVAGGGIAVRSGLIPLGGSCADDAVRLEVSASPDIAPTLREAAGYAKEHEVTSDGNCLDVRVSAEDSSKVAERLKAGKDPGFHAWVPDASMWVDQANSGGNSAQVSPTGAIASTPVAVGMTEKAAKKLGWPEKTYSWAELAAAGSQGDSLRLGSADPARSATGLLALTEVAGQAGASKGGSAQVAAAAKILAERTVDSDTQLLDTLARDDSGAESGDPKRNDALILTEQRAFTRNKESGHALDLFYPKGGSPALDYPYVIPDNTELSTAQSRAAVRFMTFLNESHGQRLLRADGFRAEGGTADAELARAAGARAPQPYGAPTADPPSAKALQETRGMWTITVQSARLLVVVDASPSMAEPVPGRGQSRMDVTKASLLQALAQFTPADDIGLWEFATRLDGDRDYRELVPTARLGARKGSSGTQREALTAAFGALQPQPGGATGLYDTTLAAYREASEDYAADKFNAVVLLTDGTNEEPGSMTRGELLTRLRDLADPAHPLPLVAIAVGPEAAEDDMEAIGGATGGSGFKVDDPAQIHEVINNAIVEAGSRQQH
ncbi:substrate-binding and VWA domain-containing protein [Streptomyces sp. SPB074]|uniref:substrate-binding and VWA domain-containing protein n=1 Tax=Streptomyces sp. (strain SPB074) TaxID=465543 RepID=UPI00017F0EA9|nr:substrate-binding and VWA domain-containing protein [Streptomyces sp. SPB074]EDY45027.1 von Willebrand factor, type A [Streptomyces sp. SPB074]